MRRRLVTSLTAGVLLCGHVGAGPSRGPAAAPARAAARQAAFGRFLPLQTTYSPVNAYLCMYTALLNYEAAHKPGVGTREELQERLRARLREYGLEHVDFLRDETTDTHCIVASTRGYVLVSFRGTEQSHGMSWLTNMRALQVGGARWNRTKVHRGFANALGSILDDVRATVSRHCQVQGIWKKPVWLTGHSMGGAVAVLCAFRLKQEKYLVQGVYTFGQPAVGGPSFIRQVTEELKIPYFRVVNYNDLVPKLPARDLLGLRYAHGGELCFFTRTGELLVDPSEESLRANPNPFHLGDVVKLGPWVKGHLPSEYLRLLYEQLPPESVRQLPPPPPSGGLAAHPSASATAR